MENQQSHQSEISAEQTKKGNAGKRLSMAGSVLGIIATAFAIIWLTMFADGSSSRLSSSSEIAAQIEFQDSLEITLEEFQQKVDFATKEGEQISDSILKAIEQ